MTTPADLDKPLVTADSKGEKPNANSDVTRSTSSAMPRLPARSGAKRPANNPQLQSDSTKGLSPVASIQASSKPASSSQHTEDSAKHSTSDGKAAPAEAQPSSSTAVSATRPSKSVFMPTLPPRTAPAVLGPVLDADEPDDVQRIRRQIHGIRVSLIRAAQRLGYDHDNGLVKQVLYRLNLAEKLKAPWKKVGSRRPEPALVAARDASRLEQEQGSDAVLDFTVKILFIGLTGTGKTQLIHSLLEDPAPAVDPFDGGTRGVQVLTGVVHGIRFECIDTPGLVAGVSQTVTNNRILQQIRRAYRSHKPDLVVYMDRLDAVGRSGGELPALKVLSDSLGAQLWLNTIVALTHAGAPLPHGPKGRLSFDVYANQKSHLLQQIIRHASGDGRLMNPMAFVDSHPTCRRNAAGEPVLANGMSWRQHLYLMIVSAKLLADTENMLQMQGNGPGTSTSSPNLVMQQMMAQARQLPLPYLMSQFTQFSKPLKYPNHAAVMEVRRLQAMVHKLPHPKQRRDAVRQVKARLLQMKQAQQYKDKMQRSFKMATLAGGKVTPEPPRLATRRPPSVHPPVTYRYRMAEPTEGWIVRPHIEAHGMDNSDGIEGLQIEKSAVRRKEGEQLGGMPYHHSLSAQVSKDQRVLQARSEGTMYHDPLGNLTSSLSAELQTSGATAGPADALVTLRCDVRRKRFLWRRNKGTVGVLLTRIFENGKPHQGPLAVGARLQDSFLSQLGQSPLEVNTALGCMSSVSTGLLERDVCLGANMEATIEARGLGSKHGIPITINANALRYKGETMTGLAASAQYKAGRKNMMGARVQLSKGKAGVSAKVKSGTHWWVGLVTMMWPLGQLLVGLVSSKFGRHKGPLG